MEEFAKLRDIVEKYQYIAMDTEFPGIVARPAGNCTDYTYKTIKLNVDLLKVIQLGITFADDRGCSPAGTSTWQFNFKFDLTSVKPNVVKFREPLTPNANYCPQIKWTSNNFAILSQ